MVSVPLRGLVVFNPLRDRGHGRTDRVSVPLRGLVVFNSFTIYIIADFRVFPSPCGD